MAQIYHDSSIICNIALTSVSADAHSVCRITHASLFADFNDLKVEGQVGVKAAASAAAAAFALSLPPSLRLADASRGCRDDPETNQDVALRFAAAISCYGDFIT